jgi:hypothetical protein
LIVRHIQTEIVLLTVQSSKQKPVQFSMKKLYIQLSHNFLSNGNLLWLFCCVMLSIALCDLYLVRVARCTFFFFIYLSNRSWKLDIELPSLPFQGLLSFCEPWKIGHLNLSCIHDAWWAVIADYRLFNCMTIKRGPEIFVN